MIKKIITITQIILFFIALTSSAAAQNVHSDCQAVGEGGCGTSNPPRTCVRFDRNDGSYTITPIGSVCGPGHVGSSVLGGVPAPMAIRELSAAAGGIQHGIGIVLFISNLLTLFTIVAGIWVLFNILRAAYLFISQAGDPGTYEKVKELLTTSVIGIAIIAGAYIIAGLVGLILFNDAGYILSPQLSGWDSP